MWTNRSRDWATRSCSRRSASACRYRVARACTKYKVPNIITRLATKCQRTKRGSRQGVPEVSGIRSAWWGKRPTSSPNAMAPYEAHPTTAMVIAERPGRSMAPMAMWNA